LGTRLLFAVLSLTLVGFAPAPFPKADRSRAENQSDVEGTWRISLWELNGEREPGIEKAFRVELVKEQFIIVGATSAHREEYGIQINPAASPPSFTLSRQGTVVSVGSYRLQKDRLQMILNRGNRAEQRPTDFAGRCSLRFVLLRTKR
jgi:uncharacterized protein (TIGR03067 family)